MSKQTDPDSHDSIEEAVAGFARMTVPERPPDQPLIEAIRTSGQQSRAAAKTALATTAVFERIKSMNPLVRYASATLIVSVVACVAFLLVGTDAEGIALAEVHQAVSKHKFVRYTEIVYPVEGDPSEAKVYYRMDLRRARVECDDGTIVIEAIEKGNDTFLELDPACKTATISIMPAKDDGPSFLEELEEMRNKKETVTTREELDGKQTLVHRWIDKKRKTTETMWVDPKSKLPLRIETVYASPQFGIKRDVATGFVWDPKVEDSFFSIEPPDGYKVTIESYYQANREKSP